MKRVLVTGSTGFIGRHCLLPLQQRGYEVHAFFQGEPFCKDPSIQWYEGDLFDTNYCEKLIKQISPTHLLHLAWITQHGIYWNSFENYRWLEASLHLCRIFSTNGGKRVVVAGTCAEYDWEHQYCSEAWTPMRPNSVYGACKYSLYLLLKPLLTQLTCEFAWGRIFFTYGPYENANRIIPSLINSMLDSSPVICNNGDLVRDFLYVEELADALAALTDSEVTGPVNVASGFPIRFTDLVDRLVRMTNTQSQVVINQSAESRTEPRVLLADTKRLNQEVKWTPHSSLEEGLRKTIQWWREQ